MTSRAKIVDEYWYSIDWDVEEIWALDLPAENFPIEDLVWHLDVPIWPHEGDPYTASPNSVMAEPEKHRAEFERIGRADLVFPIDILRHKGRWMILDGIHRLSKAVMEGRQTIMVRKVPMSAVTQIV